MEAQGEEIRACEVWQWHAGAPPMGSSAAPAHFGGELHVQRPSHIVRGQVW